MSIAVEHDKRKKEILEKSLDIFVAEGYEDTTFQKIAERCGITRTILYLYFKNKREIFSFSIKLFTEKLEQALKQVAGDTSLSQVEKLSAIASMAVAECARNRRLLQVIIDYLGHIRASGGDPDERVRRRTIRLRHIIAGVMIEGQKKGEFGAFSVKAADDLVYALVEAAIFRLAVLGRDEVSGIADAARLFATGLAAMAGIPAARLASPSTAPASGGPKGSRP